MVQYGTAVCLVAGQAWPRDAKSVFAANEFPKSPEQGPVFQQQRACLKEVPLGQALQSAVGSAALIRSMKFMPHTE